MLWFVVIVLALIILFAALHKLRSFEVEDFNVQGPGYNLIASQRTDALVSRGIRYIFSMDANVVPQQGVYVSMSAFDAACTYIPPAADTFRLTRCNRLENTVDDIASCIHVPRKQITCDRQATIRISYMNYLLVKITVPATVSNAGQNEVILTSTADHDTFMALILHRPCFVNGSQGTVYGVKSIVLDGGSVRLSVDGTTTMNPILEGNSVITFYASKYFEPIPILSNIMINAQLQAEYKTDIVSVVVPGFLFDNNTTTLSSSGLLSLSVSKASVIVDGVVIDCPQAFANSEQRHVVVTRSCDMVLVALFYNNSTRSHYWIRKENMPRHPGYPLAGLQEFVNVANSKGYMTHVENVMHVLSIPNLYELAWTLGYRFDQPSSSS